MSTVYSALCPAEFKQLEAQLTKGVPHTWSLSGPKVFSTTWDQAVMHCMRLQSRLLQQHLSFDTADHQGMAAQNTNGENEADTNMDNEAAPTAISSVMAARNNNGDGEAVTSAGSSVMAGVLAAGRIDTKLKQALSSLRQQARRIGATSSRDLLTELVLLSVPLAGLPEANRSIHDGQRVVFHTPARASISISAGANFHKVVLSCSTADGTNLQVQLGERLFCSASPAVGKTVRLYEDPVHCILCKSAAMQRDVLLSQICVMPLFEFTAINYQLDPCFNQTLQPFPHYTYTVQD